MGNILEQAQAQLFFTIISFKTPRVQIRQTFWRFSISTGGKREKCKWSKNASKYWY